MASRVAERESMSTAVRAIPREEVSPAESLFLLIVDADRWARDLSREVAASMGFKVYTAENTRAALRQMEVQPVDVVLLDVRQSTQDGVDLLAKFKEMHPQTEIIMVSGQATVDSVVTAMKSGACDFIRKPFKGEELKALLTRAAGRLRNSLEDRISREHLQPTAGYNGYARTLPGNAEAVSHCHQGCHQQTSGIGPRVKAAQARKPLHAPSMPMGLSVTVLSCWWIALPPAMAF